MENQTPSVECDDGLTYIRSYGAQGLLLVVGIDQQFYSKQTFYSK